MASNPYINKVEYGGTTLIDLTSDTVTSASMLSGITAHDASGALVTGSISSQVAQTITPTTSNIVLPSGIYLSGDQTILGDPNLIAANIAKNISIFGVLGTFEGGSSIEMESGTFKPSSDIAHPSISFSNTHTTPPSFAWIAYNGFVHTSSMMVFLLFDPVALFGFPMYYNSTNTRKGAYFMGYRGTGSVATFSSGVITYGTDSSGSSDNTYYRYYATESQFKPYSGSGQRYFRSANTFSWKAYWL